MDRDRDRTETDRERERETDSETEEIDKQSIREKACQREKREKYKNPARPSGIHRMTEEWINKCVTPPQLKERPCS